MIGQTIHGEPFTVNPSWWTLHGEPFTVNHSWWTVTSKNPEELTQDSSGFSVIMKLSRF